MTPTREGEAGGNVCGWCKGPHPVSDWVYEESPFCVACLSERIRLAQESILSKGGVCFLYDDIGLSPEEAQRGAR